MALNSSTLQPVVNSNTLSQKNIGSDVVASLFSMVILSVYAGQRSRRQLRKIKRKMTWLLFRDKVKSVFSKAAEIDRRTLMYILLGILVLALLFISPVAALILAIIGLVLLLTGTI